MVETIKLCATIDENGFTCNNKADYFHKKENAPICEDCKILYHKEDIILISNK